MDPDSRIIEPRELLECRTDFIGPIRSLFDYTTFFVMLYVFGCWDPARASLFQTGWFVESLITQTLVVHVIRTNEIPFIKSRASWQLTMTTLSIMAFAAWLPSSRRRAMQISVVALRTPDLGAVSRFCLGDFQPIFSNLQAQPAKKAHIDVGQPYQRETRNEIPSPVIEQQGVTGDEHEEDGDVMTQAILAREQVEEFAREEAPARFAFGSAPVARRSKHFFVR
jgi:hypothetical protein